MVDFTRGRGTNERDQLVLLNVQINPAQSMHGLITHLIGLLNSCQRNHDYFPSLLEVLALALTFALALSFFAS